MTAENYIDDRLQPQIEWYSKAATTIKKRYFITSTSQLVVASLIPFFAGFLTEPALPWIVGAAGIIAAICSGLLNLFKWQENWLLFRATSEALKHEKFLFLTQCAPYDGDDRVKILAQRIESMISRENSNWSQYTKQSNKDSAKPSTGNG